MEPMSVTDEVSREDRFKVVKDLHPENMLFMSVTAEVSNDDKSIEERDEQL